MARVRRKICSPDGRWSSIPRIVDGRLASVIPTRHIQLNCITPLHSTRKLTNRRARFTYLVER